MNNMNLSKKNLVIYSICGVVLLIAVLCFNVISNDRKEKIEIADVEENASSISTNEENIAKFDITDTTESASSEIGKTIEQAEEEIAKKTKEEKNKENNEENMKKETKEESKEKESNNEKDMKTETKEETKKELQFSRPVEGEILNKFAKDNLIYSKTLCEWITHQGIDIKADKTSVVKASEDGIVKSIKNDPRYGLTVIISHENGFETVYSNLLTAEFVVEKENITKGQTIGTVGNTSSFESLEDYHLHFELLKDGEYVDPEIYVSY